MTIISTPAATPDPAPTATYAAAYARLTAIAHKLRAPATAATVDGLAADVRAAQEAYATCRARLDAIRREVGEAIGPAEDGAII